MKKTDVHELRKDPLLGRWIAVLNEPKSPSDYVLSNTVEDVEESCILCAGREAETEPEIMSLPMGRGTGNKGGWRTRVIPNIHPVFQIEGDLGRRGEGIYDKMNSIGANEIIIESPDHVRAEDSGLDQMAGVLATYRARIADLEKDPRLRYTLIYKNSGKEAGEIYSHPVSHIASTPVIPKRVKEELDGAKEYYSYKERCIFCDITREELRVGTRVISETRHFVNFCPYASKFPFESWIVPKRHHCAYQDITNDELEDLAVILSTILKKMRSAFCGPGPAFNYFIHSAPNRVPRKDHWHTLGEDFHWHLEIMPRLLRTSGFEWGSGFYILPTSPEDASKCLREA
jgi:UDPglucose--hexose-1-phosphate uridylyltransferase